MTEALDSEFGRLLVETGLATRNQDGSLSYDPKASNTVIVIVGDNGSLAAAVKLPFDPTRAKGSAYQPGVWDPLIIAGAQVVPPDREVDQMVNMFRSEVGRGGTEWVRTCGFRWWPEH